MTPSPQPERLSLPVATLVGCGLNSALFSVTALCAGLFTVMYGTAPGAPAATGMSWEQSMAGVWCFPVLVNLAVAGVLAGRGRSDLARGFLVAFGITLILVFIAAALGWAWLTRPLP